MRTGDLAITSKIREPNIGSLQKRGEGMGKISISSTLILIIIASASVSRADALQEACETAFYKTVWAKDHEFLRCTDQGWIIARKTGGQGEVECLVLSPGRKLTFVLGGREKTSLYFSELVSEKYLLSSNQEAVVTVRLDKKQLHQAFQSVLVSKAPPLRYAFGITQDNDVQMQIARGHVLTATIAGRDWRISLRGSLKALEQAENCIAQSTGDTQ